MSSASAFYPKRDETLIMAISRDLKSGLKECSEKEGRSMSEIAHLGIERIVKQLQKQHKKEGK